jgi:hypothetical protein
MGLRFYPVILSGSSGTRLWGFGDRQSGGYLGEDDIVRLEDRYKRG